MKFDFRSESLKRSFSFTPFVYNFMIECSKKNWEITPEQLLNGEIQKPWIKILTPGLVRISL